ncbi:50S ribosomal protein L15e [Candidatus Woesearchaeota archaeon]|jgi:large subunit ribosomal protein L15e|nr:50S ribosomal protein L15e [Candidatus Woesearchaeota archaeon]MBT4151418.1 50S ribosomal protein L15e [Candidatus Woesearchaeota archaeon]MBT4247816.1 50S ribosomal protein L15e [Candidatus Woesearchaeota archaeon]MBT4434240.1 50S ribosomal protein L15e [Candidatus Woesearchaeota archaeon]MBT7331839.1 50S ribosomal protein L15e [Candidatus Woesearchaeota archaeon]
MGIYIKIREIWKKPKEGLGPIWRERLLAWRKEDSTVRIERPTRLDRARSLGYKAKQGIIVVRQRVPRGGHTRPQIKKGRRPKRYGTRLNLSKNYQQIAEERAQKKFVNLTVLNSYWVMEDGIYYWYEIIMVDPKHPVIKSDKNLQWLQSKRSGSRVFHGKTSSGKKGRGMRKA